jgi:SET domain-containing protein
MDSHLREDEGRCEECRGMKQLQKISLLFFLMTFSCLGKQYEPCGTAEQKYSSQRQKKKLFACVGCQYLNFMEIDVSGFDQIEPTKTSHYLESKSTIIELSKKYRDKVENYTLAPMYLQWMSKDIGYGIFAKENISTGDFIGVYTGQVRLMRGVDDAIAEDVDYAWYYPIDAPNGTRLLLDGKFKGNELRFINHDQHPNTKCIDVLVNGKFYMCYVATHDIAKDAQLTISYGDGYWNSRKINPENIKS